MSVALSSPRELSHTVLTAIAQQREHPFEEVAASLLEMVGRAFAAECGYVAAIAEDCASSRLLAHWQLGGRESCTPPSSLIGRLARGEAVVITRGADNKHQDSADRDVLRDMNLRSLALMPFTVRDDVYALGLINAADAPLAADDWMDSLHAVSDALAVWMETDCLNRELHHAKADLAKYRQRFESQTQASRDEVLDTHDFEDIVGRSAAMLTATAAVREVAPTDTNVLLLGETGTGKELFARAVHDHSPRRNKPFVCVNCAALPSSLIESELFGHERGAFTGAITARQGRFELADHGTIFLDEIGDLPLDLQPKLLRVLQEREFERVGSSVRRRIDVRVIAATHQDLLQAVAQGRFRADLYYRLSVFPITLAPLRDRREDIPQLVWFLINQRQRRLHKRITEIVPETMTALQRYSWPGNVRELENVLERAMIHSSGSTLRLDEQLVSTQQGEAVFTAQDDTLEALEREHIERMLRRCRGRINGPGNAAERLGLHPNTLRFRMKKLGIVRPSIESVPMARPA